MCIRDRDYVASFTSDGTVTVSIVKTGAAKSEKSLKASFVQLDPSAVTYEDVIGSIDAVTKKKTGLELVNMVYPKYGYVPSLLLAPGWSHIPAEMCIRDRCTSGQIFQPVKI